MSILYPEVDQVLIPALFEEMARVNHVGIHRPSDPPHYYVEAMSHRKYRRGANRISSPTAPHLYG